MDKTKRNNNKEKPDSNVTGRAQPLLHRAGFTLRRRKYKEGGNVKK